MSADLFVVRHAVAFERELRPAEPTLWETKTSAFGG